MQAAAKQSSDLIAEGKQIFRFDTFGDEDFWGGQLQLHQAIQGEQFGGVGPGVSPNTALAVGLKVDVEALPAGLQKQLKRGQVNLDDPATTVALLKLNAVVGVTGFFDSDGNLSSMGIQCALCHSTVDDSLAPGIGHRLDGWANRDLNVGAIIASAPNLKPFRDLLGVDRERRAGERAGAERAPVEPGIELIEPLAVALERLGDAEQIPAERHRLRRLQVRVAGHDDIGMRRGALEGPSADREHVAGEIEHHVARTHAIEGGSEVVAAAGDVEASARAHPDQSDQVRLVVEVRVLSLGVERHDPGPLLLHPAQALGQLTSEVTGDQPAPGEHHHVRLVRRGHVGKRGDEVARELLGKLERLLLDANVGAHVLECPVRLLHRGNRLH